MGGVYSYRGVREVCMVNGGVVCFSGCVAEPPVCC